MRPGRRCARWRPSTLSRLVGVAGADEPEVRNRPQRGVGLDGLMGRPVLAEPDRVVRPGPDDRELAQRRQAHRRPHVVAEDQEGGAVRRDDAAVQASPFDDRAHRVLADPERDVAARPLRAEARRRPRTRCTSTRRDRPPLRSWWAPAARNACMTCCRPRGWRAPRRRESRAASPRRSGRPTRRPTARAPPGKPAPRRRTALPRALVLPPRADAVHVLVAPRAARGSTRPDPSREPPSSHAPRARPAGCRAPSTCRPHAARRRRCASGRR